MMPINLTYPVKWWESSSGHELEMTQFAGVLVAHTQPSLHALLVHETKATPAVAGTGKELPSFRLRVPRCLTDPTGWWGIVTTIDAETFN